MGKYYKDKMINNAELSNLKRLLKLYSVKIQYGSDYKGKLFVGSTDLMDLEEIDKIDWQNRMREKKERGQKIAEREGQREEQKHLDLFQEKLKTKNLSKNCRKNSLASEKKKRLM